MKLFVVVLGAILAVAFVSWMTLSLSQAVQHRHDAQMKPAPDQGAEPSK